MVRRFAFILSPVALLALSGCATMTGEPLQSISVHTVDADGRYVGGMRCRMGNGAADYFGNSPLLDVQVRRSASDLKIECRHGAHVARATAVARGRGLAAAMLPGGSAAVLIDHVTGYAYAYPRAMQLRIGEHLVFDAAAPARPAADETADEPR